MPRRAVESTPQREGDNPEGRVWRQVDEDSGIGQCFIQIAEMRGDVSALRRDVEAMGRKLDDLEADRQQRKGALWLGACMWAALLAALGLFWPDIKSALKGK